MLDPDQFHVVCLVQNAASEDPIARRYKRTARDWIEVDGLSDTALTDLARDQKIDILIDLGGYGDAGRMAACANRLAPVQIKWVGMQAHSSGLAEMDWFMTDRWETPEGFDQFYSEKLLRLPDGYVCYSPPPLAPDVLALPALRNGFVTFGCFNNLAKVTPRVIQVWGEILRRVPDSKMILKTHQLSHQETAANFLRRFSELGIDGGRVALRGSSGRICRCRHRSGSISLLWWSHDVRGTLDGRSHDYDARRNLRVPAFGKPHEQRRATGLGRNLGGRLHRDGGQQSERPKRPGRTASRLARAGQAKPVVRRQPLRP